MDGNAAWAAISLGRGDHGTAEASIERLLDWQWPDGGWNCDRRRGVTHSSFNESFAPLRALAARGRRGGALGRQASAGAARAAEFLLRHRVDRSHRSGGLAHPALARLRWPPYWHYDRLTGLRALREAGVLDDPRTADALLDLRAARRDDGTWSPDGRHWLRPGARGANVEVVDWTADGERRMLTLLAREVLSAG